MKTQLSPLLFGIPIRPEGPRPAKIAIVGEAPGKTEAEQRRPFVGSAGQELNHWLKLAGQNRSEIFLTNTFLLRPPANQISQFGTDKREATLQYRHMLPEFRRDYPELDWPAQYDWPPIATGSYLSPQHFDKSILRLHQELKEVAPNIIIPLGNVASIAILKQAKISKIRGTVFPSWLLPGTKALPTYHPAAIFRQMELAPIAKMDILKAVREAENPAIHYDNFEIWTEPCLIDIEQFLCHWEQHPKETIAIDIETAPGLGLITHVGFGNAEKAIVIPFVSRKSPDGNYWESRQIESQAWKYIQAICALPNPKVLQNGLYDQYWLWRQFKIRIRNYQHDTMIASHADQPEMPRSLDFIASTRLNVPSWKSMRSKAFDAKES